MIISPQGATSSRHIINYSAICMSRPMPRTLHVAASPLSHGLHSCYIVSPNSRTGETHSCVGHQNALLYLYHDRYGRSGPDVFSPRRTKRSPTLLSLLRTLRTSRLSGRIWRARKRSFLCAAKALKNRTPTQSTRQSRTPPRPTQRRRSRPPAHWATAKQKSPMSPP